MNIIDFEVENELEDCLLKTQKGEVELRVFLERLKDSALFVPSGTGVNDDLSGFTGLPQESRTPS